MPPRSCVGVGSHHIVASMFENSFHSHKESPLPQPDASPKSSKPDSRKLRASCDGCYMSKVKCTKETPTCARCLNHGVVCKYSPSQRVGKPRRLREDQQTHVKSKALDSGTSKSPSARSTSDASVHPPLYSWNLNFDPSATTRRHGLSLEDEISRIWQGAFSVPDSEKGVFREDSGHESSLSSPSNSLPTPIESVQDYPIASQPSSSSLETIGSSLNSQQPPSLFSNEPMLLPEDFTPLYFPQPQNPTTALPNIPAPDTCICDDTTFDILRTLHDQSSNNTFDKVLAANKSAVTTISKILACPCTRDSTSIMTLAVALTKIMSRYQSIGRSPSHDSTGNSNPDGPSTAPLPAPITLGAYELDGAEEEQIKLQVVLSELRKVDSIMARYQQRFCGGGVKHEARVYGELVTFLRRRLRDIVEGLQKDLQTIYEGSSF